jgi:hypothetical protein
MIRTLAIALGLACALGASSSCAQAPVLRPELAPLGFLVGDWISAEGVVAETGGRSRGASHVTIEAGGAVLLRRDHTELSDAAGKPAGGFDQIMMIWPEAGAVRADYSDGTHIIHYGVAAIEPGRSVTFASEASPSGPGFRLVYRLTAPGELSVAFGMAPPGGQLRPIASGVLRKAP